MDAQNPVYLQLREQLLSWIIENDLTSQDKLPPERVLAEKFSTTRVTLRQALAQLQAEGRIYRANRRGWFVTPQRLNYDPSKDVGFNVYVREQGCVPKTETISKVLIEVPEWLAAKCNIPISTQLYHFIRKRYVDNRCLLVEHNYINSVGCEGLLEKNTDNSLWQLLQSEYNLKPSKRNIEIYPQALLGEEADLLGVNQGSAGLYLQRISYDMQGEFLEFDHEYWLHDALKLVVNINP